MRLKKNLEKQSKIENFLSPVISFQRVAADIASSVIFPGTAEDLSGDIGFDFIPAQVELPPTLFQARAEMAGETISDIFSQCAIFIRSSTCR